MDEEDIELRSGGPSQLGWAARETGSMGRDADEVEMCLTADDEARARAVPSLKPPGMAVIQKIGKHEFFTAEAAKAYLFSLKRSPYAGKIECWPNL